jgi:hypothetical protein
MAAHRPLPDAAQDRPRLRAVQAGDPRASKSRRWAPDFIGDTFGTVYATRRSSRSLSASLIATGVCAEVVKPAKRGRADPDAGTRRHPRSDRTGSTLVSEADLETFLARRDALRGVCRRQVDAPRPCSKSASTSIPAPCCKSPHFHHRPDVRPAEKDTLGRRLQCRIRAQLARHASWFSRRHCQEVRSDMEIDAFHPRMGDEAPRSCYG